MIMIYIPCSCQEEAEKLSILLLEKALIGCANIFPSVSLYKDYDLVQKATESVLIVKTAKILAERVIEELEKIHSYDTPCIVHLDATANADYKQWLYAQVRL